jgi:hypothetical protein
MGDLSTNFDRAEFACKCGCGLDAISKDLVDNLQHARTILGIPFAIDSGIRCAKHNAAVGGKSNSAHLRGLAADIACTNDHIRYLMLWDFIRRFRRIEIGDTWLHIDIDTSLPQEVVFLK